VIAKLEWFFEKEKAAVPPAGVIDPFLVGRVLQGFTLEIHAEFPEDAKLFKNAAVLRVWVGREMVLQLAIRTIPGATSGKLYVLPNPVKITPDTVIAMQADGGLKLRGKVAVTLGGMFGGGGRF